MATATFECRVCGKEYEACRNANRIDGVFRWQDVACSPEHGSIYLDLIRKSRAKQHDAVASNRVADAFALFDEEYLNDEDDEMSEVEFEDAEDPEIEV